jgi:ABC-type branched-subunit amino acid transport system substrate-binding protein
MSLAAAAPAAAPTSMGAWVAAALVIAMSLVSTFTISTDDGANVSAGGARDGSGDEFVEDEGLALGEATDGATSGATSGARRSGPTRRVIQSGGSAGGPGSGPAAGPTGGPTAGPGGGPAVDADCAKNQNAGASADGVTAREVFFAATIVKTGVARDFLQEAQVGMEAVVQKTNRNGGVCGRLIRVKYDDDGWVPSKGQQFIRNYINEKKYFGLAVNPSSEGLKGAIDSGDIQKAGFPVIGADGMLVGQYTQEWVWPVATSTHSVAHIACKDAYARGARRFGIVWEGNYRFGVEGQKAFAGCVSRLSGASIVANQELQGGQLEYPNQANSFVGKCSNSNQDLAKCDFIFLLLEPATADAWRKSNGMSTGEVGKRPAKGFGAPQPLFIDSFAKGCGRPCANLRVWTSFKPPIDPFDKEAPVQTYLNDLRSVSSSADASNPHVQGAYVGMTLVVRALEAMGAAPTRAKAKATLDAITLDTGLHPPLTFKPGDHFAAIYAQPFEAIYNLTSGSATFTGWRYAGSGQFVSDADVKKDL